MTAFAPIADESQDDDRRWSGVARVAGPSWARLPSLTVGLFGVSMLWSVEMSYGPPYLLSLGLPKSLMAIVFLAGPLSGLIVQPLIGIIADNSKSRFGRRRPIILVSAALCAITTLLFGFARPFASIFTTLHSSSNDTLTIWLAVISIYCIDFCVNVQALDRALLVDTLPTTKQPAGNAWAARMVGVGGVAGFFIGNLDLPHLLPFFGNVQLEVLSVITVLLLLSSQAWVCFHVKERVLLGSSSPPKGLAQELKDLQQTLVRLPSVIRRIFWIQFFAWVGWFPVLFYSTVYVGDLHKNSSPIPQNQDAAIALDAESTRLGTRALLFNALVSLAANIILPSFVAPQRTGYASSPLQPKHKTWLDRVRMPLANLWALSHLLFVACMAATFVTSTVSGATLILSVVGFCWAITQWAPFALLGEAILSQPASDDAGAIHLADTRSTRAIRPRDDEETRQLFQADVDDEDEEEDMPDHHARPKTIGLGNARAHVNGIDIPIPLTAQSEGHAMTSGSTRSNNGLSAQAGTILGIHNIFLVIPQFLMTGLSSIIFAIFDPDQAVLHAGTAETQAVPQDAARGILARGDSAQKPNSIAIIFRLGGIATMIAFVLCYRLAKDLARR